MPVCTVPPLPRQGRFSLAAAAQHLSRVPLPPDPSGRTVFWLARQRLLTQHTKTPYAVHRALTTLAPWWNPPWPMRWQHAYHHAREHHHTGRPSVGG
jgi:hypothetical protein